ncbi:hypothetical protein [Nocardia sp. NPDC052112]|uniref:hypothetical protein n=1 Tax=Nocardia sp. NPDC052112 TaxID=3155646 RepID=UPI00343BFC1A
MSAKPIPVPELPHPWIMTIRSHTQTIVLLDVRRPADCSVTVELERCANGRLRDAYPVSAHDIEARVTGRIPQALLVELLATLMPALEKADPECRKIVFATLAGDTSALAAAEAAGFRYVVDIDLPDAELSLFVAEPTWVTAVDMDLDRIPGT